MHTGHHVAVRWQQLPINIRLDWIQPGDPEVSINPLSYHFLKKRTFVFFLTQAFMIAFKTPFMSTCLRSEISYTNVYFDSISLLMCLEAYNVYFLLQSVS